MNTKIKNIIRKAIIDSHNFNIKSEVDYYTQIVTKKIGNTYNDYSKPQIDIIEEFINPRTGRINHKRLGKKYQTYVYTKEMANADIKKYENELKSKITFSLAFQVYADDSHRLITFNNTFEPSEQEIIDVYNAYGDNAEHLVGFKINTYKYYGYNSIEMYLSTDPIFNEPIETEFWTARENYMKAKAAWCEKYGCN